MALLLHSSPSSLVTTKKTHLHLHHSTPKSTNLSIRSQDPSSEDTTTTTSSSSTVTPSTKPNSTGLGFGSTNDASPVTTTSKKKQKGKAVFRRAPVQKPKFASEKEEVQAKEQGQSESAFLIAWLGLGGIILVEGIILAASGFLPEKWDNFFVKYLYPSFTPTVFLFVAGSVAYGVFKYLQNEKFNSEN